MSEHKFKVGDRVKVISNAIDNSVGSHRLSVGKEATIIYIANMNDILLEVDEYIEGHDGEGRGKEGYCRWVIGDHHEKIKLVKGRPRKPKPNTHIVVWDIKGCGDPHKLFTCRKDMEKYAKDKLIDNDKIEQESIKMFSLSGEIKYTKNITFRRVKNK